MNIKEKLFKIYQPHGEGECIIVELSQDDLTIKLTQSNEDFFGKINVELEIMGMKES